MDEFKSNVKNWVLLDNAIKEKQEELKQLRNEKTDIHKEIIDFVQENNLDSSTISISDGSLKFNSTKHIQPITLQFIQQCLEEKLASDLVDDVMQHIKISRTYKYTKDIKRYKKKES